MPRNTDRPLTPFGQRLEHHRRIAGLTQAELAKRAGGSPRQYTRWIYGDHGPSPRHLAALSYALGVTTDELIGADVTLRVQLDRIEAKIDTLLRTKPS